MNEENKKLLNEYIKQDKECNMLIILSTFLIIGAFVTFGLLMHVLVNGEYTLIKMGGLLIVLFLILFSAGGVLNVRDLRIKEIKNIIESIEKRQLTAAKMSTMQSLLFNQYFQQPSNPMFNMNMGNPMFNNMSMFNK